MYIMQRIHARISAAVSIEQFRVCTDYWILKNNGATREYEEGRDEK